MNNERAFPWCGDLNDCPTINLGLTLRDYFAAKAMQTLVSKHSHEGDVSRNSYKIADAMLKARQE